MREKQTDPVARVQDAARRREELAVMAQNSARPVKRRGPGRPFRRGQSGNPGGRPKEAVHVRELARQRTEEAVKTLATIMRHGKTEAARVRAAEALLSRAWGQPTQPVEQTGEPLEIVVRYVDDWRSSRDPHA